MELILTMDESDGNKTRARTVHTQTDFGPYSAFPPPDHQQQSCKTGQRTATENG